MQREFAATVAPLVCPYRSLCTGLLILVAMNEHGEAE